MKAGWYFVERQIAPWWAMPVIDAAYFDGEAWQTDTAVTWIGERIA